MAVEGRLTRFLNKRSWIIPVLFSLMIVMLALLITAFEFRRYSVELGKVVALNSDFAFSIGGEMCAIFVAIMMTLSILPSSKRKSGYTRIFATLLTIGCSCLMLDSIQMLVDGVPELANLNTALCILVFMSEVAYLFFFYLYATYALNSEGKVSGIITNVIGVLFVIFMLLPLVNLFYPLYFSMGADGVYMRNKATWWICRLFLVFVAIGTVITIIISREKFLTKLVVSLFIAIPLLSIAAGGFKYGVSILYTSMMVSLVLIYAFIFSNHEKHLYSTNKELGLATNIQQTMLPSIFPAFPERKEFDIYATMDPAKEVGGDFYDFFLIDDNHLGIVIADVSDKGVPAALFMMASKIMVQNYAMLNISPKDVLEKVNKQICSNNQAEMFVTVWLGILDLKTGLLTASNAGHEKPIIKHADGHFELFKDVNGFVVGWDKSVKYKDYEIQLEKGSKLFLYTDGVTEASGPEGKFGRERTVNAVRKYEDKSPVEILMGMKEELDNYSRGYDQFDDITMVCVEYKGAEAKTKTLSYTHEANVKNIDKMIDPVLNSMKEVEVDHKVLYKIRLALEEVLTNVCNYAYAPGTGDVIIKSDITFEPKGVKITIIDEGKPFNPLQARDPDLDVSFQKREIGGLGIFITKNIMDNLSYMRDNNKNVLIMEKVFEDKEEAK